MNGDSRDVDDFDDSLLDFMMSIAHYLPFLRKYEHAFVSSEGCHMANSRCLILDTPFLVI